jgi:UDP-N-acetylglucosamine 2-epimerase (non-hydrolysing)
VVGARPQLVKLAPISAAMGRTDHHHVIVHTGQHYDADLSDVFFDGLGIPTPDIHLGVGSGSHGVQTGTALAALESALLGEKPDWVLVYGDTNSTLAGALAAVKQHLPVAHLEAGLRSFNRRMPEEHNRVLTDHAADLLLAPTEQAMKHLADEGLTHRSVLVGDVMADICLRIRDQVQRNGLRPTLPGSIDLGEPYVLATIHRAENTDDRDRLAAILDSLADLPVPVALLVHPRLAARANEYGLKLDRGSLQAGRPLPYAETIAAMVASAGIVTDSGGLQKEAYLLGVACTTLRSETEWPETLAGGWNVLVERPDELSAPAWADTVCRPAPSTERPMAYGDGHAAERTVDALIAAG